MKIEQLHNRLYAGFLARLMPARSEARRISVEASANARNAAEDAGQGTTYEQGASIRTPSRQTCIAIARRLDLSHHVTRAHAMWAAQHCGNAALRDRFISVVEATPDSDLTIGGILARL